jgi:hypothetical protein
LSGTVDRALILAEIKRLAAENGGRAPGRGLFERATGIREGDWYGRYWVRWNSALEEAGFGPNAMQGPTPEGELLQHLALAIRELGRFPTRAELMMRRRADGDFPSDTVFARRFGGRSGAIGRLREFCLATPEFADVAELLEIPTPEAPASPRAEPVAEFGSVYMLKSGRNYKIGRSNAFGRREREITLQLPERAGTVHVIRTDDPEGIEAYWHRRFAAKRLNGEWFALSAEDVSAFRRRKFM